MSLVVFFYKQSNYTKFWNRGEGGYECSTLKLIGFYHLFICLAIIQVSACSYLFSRPFYTSLSIFYVVVLNIEYFWWLILSFRWKKWLWLICYRIGWVAWHCWYQLHCWKYDNFYTEHYKDYPKHYWMFSFEDFFLNVFSLQRFFLNFFKKLKKKHWKILKTMK